MQTPTTPFGGLEAITCDPGTSIFDADTGEVLGVVQDGECHFHRNKVYLTHSTWDEVVAQSKASGQ